ncbi:MAG: putative peroxiredoxin [Alphaproteobacteria bacterium MarineAlpha3_Bin5]|nr:peroxiredoxin [Magnetovibrio sp.]PPR78096.1 MAG: putative peroxiredoxin [Alphaproteobacteria bacterium MarineAlpha3_Bin5]|tara:strand:+ start:684 stop:1166 length:483 start_codon:yes stop_codon:yes gene_type:complete
MTIKIGEKIPLVNLFTMTKEGPRPITTSEIFANKKVVAFGVPGAFTPTCSAKHLPGFIRLGNKIKEKGIDDIICISVNDPFVMGAWGESQNAGDMVKLIADGSGEFTKATDLALDLTHRGFGVRCQRFVMTVEKEVVLSIAVDKSGKFELTSAETLLGTL